MKDNLSSMKHIIGLIVQILLLCYFGDSKKVRHRKGDRKETYTNVVIKGHRGKAYYEDDPHIKIITDRQQIAEIMRKPVTAGGYVIEGFEPLPYPADFTVYDVSGDGRVSIEELIQVTGEAENMELAFEASDENRDGYVTRTEFNKAPWGLDVT